MGLPRPLRTKFGLSLKTISEMTGEALSALKRQSAKDPEALRAKVNKLLGGNHRAASMLVASEPDPIGDLIEVHFKIVSIRWDIRETNPELWTKLGEVLEVSRESHTTPL